MHRLGGAQIEFANTRLAFSRRAAEARATSTQRWKVAAGLAAGASKTASDPRRGPGQARNLAALPGDTGLTPGAMPVRRALRRSFRVGDWKSTQQRRGIVDPEFPPHNVGQDATFPT